MSPFDEDPSENRSELELCIDETHQLQAKNEKYKDALATKFNAEMCEALKPIRDKIENLKAEVNKAECLQEFYLEGLEKSVAELDTFKSENQSFGNVLAVIHGDGGHYITKHGHDKASEDAIQIVLDSRAENEQLKVLLKAAKCPACDNVGYLVHQVGEAEWEQEQCQWCFEKDAALKGSKP